MAKTTWGLSTWTCAIILAAFAAVAVLGVGAQAQSEWGADISEEAAAKKPPPPPPVQIGGTWDGPIVDSIQGPGTISLTFTEKSSKTKGTLKGTWTINFPNVTDGVINDVGTLTGSVTQGNDIAVTLKGSKGDALGNCKLFFNGTQSTQDSISGTYHFMGCGGTNTGTISLAPGAPPTTVFINIADDFFFPTKVTISKGQTVRWTNNGGEPHSVNANPGLEKCKPTSGEAFDSPKIDPGETFERTFNNSGTFAYHCEIHGCPMKGTITVQ